MVPIFDIFLLNTNVIKNRSNKYIFFLAKANNNMEMGYNSMIIIRSIRSHKMQNPLLEVCVKGTIFTF